MKFAMKNEKTQCENLTNCLVQQILCEINFTWNFSDRMIEKFPLCVKNQEKINNLSLIKKTKMKKHEDMSASKILRFLNLKKICSFLPSSTLPPFFRKNVIIYIKEKMIPALNVAIIFYSLFWWYFWENIKVQKVKK